MALFPRYLRLSLPRLWMRDLTYFATRPPIGGGTSVLGIEDVAAARRSRQPLISWGAIIVKAIALVAQRHPELKRCYMPLPWAHFYQHPHCVATVVVERPWHGEHAVFFYQINAPERMSLREIDRELRGLKEQPVEAFGSFRRLIRITRCPPPLRRLIWRLGLYASGRLRSRYIGTFMVNAVPSRRAHPIQSMTCLTTSFFYGLVAQDGDMPIQMFFDHRAMDGATAARLVVDLHATLRREIVAELNANT